MRVNSGNRVGVLLFTLTTATESITNDTECNHVFLKQPIVVEYGAIFKTVPNLAADNARLRAVKSANGVVTVCNRVDCVDKV